MAGVGLLAQVAVSQASWQPPSAFACMVHKVQGMCMLARILHSVAASSVRFAVCGSAASACILVRAARRRSRVYFYATYLHVKIITPTALLHGVASSRKVLP